MRKRSWIVVLSMGISSLFCAQTAQVRLLDSSYPETHSVGPDLKAVNLTSLEIKKKRPEIPTRVLDTDEAIIDQAQPAVQAEFKKVGLDDDDAMEASLVAWKEVRINSPLQPGKTMHRESFVEFVTSMGKVVFKSKPDKARVTVGTKLLGPTEVKRWYASGTLSVLFEKEGFESVTKTCEVSAPGFNECEAELKPKQD